MIARIFLFSETLSLIFAHARKKVCLSFMKNIPFSVPSIFQGFSYFVPFQAIILEAPPRIELGMRALQAPALPLGYGAVFIF